MEIIRQAGAKEKREIFPNISNGIGTLGWIRKNMDVPFEPNARNDETHTNGISGKFTIKQEDQEYIVHYMIAHLGSRAEALCSLFAMQCNQYGQRVDVDRIAGMTRVHPGLVGDYDLCVKPILNELGMPVADSENAWICFVRGNTAVMLKVEKLQGLIRQREQRYLLTLKSHCISVKVKNSRTRCQFRQLWECM